MPLRTLFRYLANHPEVINRLAESYPIRRAAQLTAYLIHRSKETGQRSLDDFLKSSTTRQIKEQASETGNSVQSFSKTFTEELKDGLRKMNEEIKKQK
ncbi:protein NCBP2AS2 homolog [Lineus longissimus]|uniref:protein NCBP2AS2 homolog n=1 Tax=Lineus longissimus TaxID=88925 RepID=UPI002B4E3A26